MHDVFISYSTQDKPVADAVCAGLEQRGIRCWIAPRDILAGMEWGQAIVEAISSAKIMVLLLSANANKSPQIPKEVDRAMNKGVTVVPLRIEDVQPAGALEYYLGPAHWLDAINPPMQAHIDRLATNISALLLRGSSPGVQQAKPQPAAPTEPASNLGIRQPAPPPIRTPPPVQTPQRPVQQQIKAPVAPPASYPSTADSPVTDNTRILLYIVSGVIPIAGIIFFFVYNSKPFPSDQKMAKICLIVGIVSFVLSILFGCLCALAGSAGQGY